MTRGLLILPFAIGLVSCGGNAPRTAEAQAPAVANVETVTVSMQEWSAIYEATGTVRARTTATVSSRVMAYVQRVTAQAGDRVRQGQALVLLDGRELETAVRRAEAARAESRAAIAELDNGLHAATANLELAKATFGRMKDLADKRSISNQEFDEATARLKSAEANEEAARARRAQLDSKIAQAEQEVAAASLAREYATINAPFSGVVTARTVEPGNLATPGAPLLTIEQDAGYRLEAVVDESKAPFIRAGETVEISLDGAGGTYHGRVSEIVPAVDAGSRTFTVKIDLPAVARLRSGAFGRAHFPVGSQKVMTVPAAAVLENGQLQSVFVVEDGAAHSRMVTTGRRMDGAVELLSGLKEGERIVSPPAPGLHDGARVEARK